MCSGDVEAPLYGENDRPCVACPLQTDCCDEGEPVSCSVAMTDELAIGRRDHKSSEILK